MVYEILCLKRCSSLLLCGLPILASSSLNNNVANTIYVSNLVLTDRGNFNGPVDSFR